MAVNVKTVWYSWMCCHVVCGRLLKFWRTVPNSSSGLSHKSEAIVQEHEQLYGAISQIIAAMMLITQDEA